MDRPIRFVICVTLLLVLLAAYVASATRARVQAPGAGVDLPQPAAASVQARRVAPLAAL